MLLLLYKRNSERFWVKRICLNNFEETISTQALKSPNYEFSLNFGVFTLRIGRHACGHGDMGNGPHQAQPGGADYVLKATGVPDLWLDSIGNVLSNAGRQLELSYFREFENWNISITAAHTT